MTIYDEAMQMKEELVACRRDLHAHPELACAHGGCLHEGR